MILLYHIFYQESLLPYLQFAHLQELCYNIARLGLNPPYAQKVFALLREVCYNSPRS